MTRRSGWGEGQIIEVAPGKHLIRASGGSDISGKRIRPSRIVYGTRRDANRALRSLQDQLDQGTYIPAENMLFGEWMSEWFEAEYGVEIGASRDELLQSRHSGRTAETYESIIRVHLLQELGNVPLQKLRSTHLRSYFNSKKDLASATLSNHYIVLNGILNAAVRERILRENPAKHMMGKPSSNKHVPKSVLDNCWDADEAQQFLAAAKQSGPQWAAFFTLALDSGMRKGELCGLQWDDIDWDTGTVTIQRTLIRASKNKPIFGPVKNRKPRTIMIAPETISLLKAHRKHQVEIQLAIGRDKYKKYNLVFAKEPGKYRRKDTIGAPLQSNNLTEREYAEIVKRAGVRLITFHGLRHTCATLLLKDRVAPHYVQTRLGHKDVRTTLNTYGHAIPSGEKEMIKDICRIFGLTETQDP
jgi:integrase